MKQQIIFIIIISLILGGCGDFLEPKSKSEFVPKDANSIYEMWGNSDAMVVDASFLRCTQISLSWNVPVQICAKFGATNCSISANVNNPFVIGSSRFNGFDPELGDSVMPKVFSFGLSVGF